MRPQVSFHVEEAARRAFEEKLEIVSVDLTKHCIHAVLPSIISIKIEISPMLNAKRWLRYQARCHVVHVSALHFNTVFPNCWRLCTLLLYIKSRS